MKLLLDECVLQTTLLNLEVLSLPLQIPDIACPLSQWERVGVRVRSMYRKLLTCDQEFFTPTA
jgi:hypothetical protein